MTDSLATAGPGGSSSLLLMFALMVVMMIWMMSNQRRRAKKTQALQESLRDGDPVITSAGIFGTLRGLEGDRARVEIAPTVVIEIDRRQIVPVPEHLRADRVSVGAPLPPSEADRPGGPVPGPSTSSQE